MMHDGWDAESHDQTAATAIHHDLQGGGALGDAAEHPLPESRRTYRSVGQDCGCGQVRES